MASADYRLSELEVINGLGCPILIVDRQGHILRFNPAAGSALRLDGGAIGVPAGVIFGLSVDDMLMRAWERRTPISAVTTLKYIDHEAPPVYNISLSPMADDTCVLVWQDITGLRDAERIRVDHEKAATRRVLDTFSRYMSATLAERILGDPDILTRREMRDAVVLFADLRGFTRLTVEQPPNLALTILNDWFSQMMEVVNEYEGLVFNTAGDELMISFNVPYAQPKASQTAVLAAVAMNARFDGMRTLLRDEQINLGMGVGVNRGLVVLGHVGGQHRMTYTMVGEAVNLAHRLVEVAEDGEIVITESMLIDGVPDHIRQVINPLGPVELKGISETEPLFRIDTHEIAPPHRGMVYSEQF